MTIIRFPGRENRFAHKRDAILAEDRTQFSAREMHKRPRFSNLLTDHLVPAGGTIALQVEVKGRNIIDDFSAMSY